MSGLPETGGFKPPETGGFVAPESGTGTFKPPSGSKKLEPVEPKKPLSVTDPRVARWKAAWLTLYLRGLPRERHEAERDIMFRWAHERGKAEVSACLSGLLASRSYTEVFAPEDFPFGKVEVAAAGSGKA